MQERGYQLESDVVRGKVLGRTVGKKGSDKVILLYFNLKHILKWKHNPKLSTKVQANDLNSSTQK